jgi:hypothetical protein
MIEWHEFIERRQTEEEFRSLRWEQADGLGIIIPKYPINDYYVGAIDQDTHEGHPERVTLEAEEIGKKVMSKMPITYFEKTPHKGHHHIYRSKKPVKSENFLKEAGLELLGGGRLLIVYPTPGYEKMNDNPLTIVEDLNQTFYNALKSMGIDTYESKEQSIETEVKDRARIEYDEKLLNKILEVLRPRIEENKESCITIHCPFHPPDNHPSFVIYKNSYVAVDFHEMIGINKWKTYTLKELAKKLGIEIPNDLEEILEKLGVPLREIDDRSTLIEYLLKVIDVIGEGLKHLDPEQMILLKRLGVPERFFYDFWHNMDVKERLDILNNSVGWLYNILSEITVRIIHKTIKKLKMVIVDEDELNEAIREVTKNITLDLKTSDRVKIVAYAINKLDLLNFVLVWYESNKRLVGINDSGILIENTEDILNRYANMLFGEWVNALVKRELKDIIKMNVVNIEDVKLNATRYLRVNNAIIDLETLDVLEPSNDIMFTSKLNIDVEPTIIHMIKTYPINELENRFKDNLFEKTFSKFYDPEDWFKLKVLIGSILSNAAKIIVVIYGDPNTLKTTLLNILYNTLNPIVGKIKIAEIGKKQFPYMGITYETRCIIDSEFSETVINAVEELKEKSGGDILKIDRKYLPPLHLNLNSLKMFLSTNELPKFGKLDNATLDRLYLIPTQLPSDFIPDPNIHPDRDVLLDKKLREQVFYYILYCYRLYKEYSNKLKDFHDINETREMLIEGSYPLKEWENAKPERIIKDENAKETFIDLWNDFIEWRQGLTDNKLFDKMNQIGKEKFKRLLESRYQKIIHGGRVWFKGIRLTNKPTLAS